MVESAGGKLLIYAPLSKEKAWKTLQEAAKQSGLYSEIIRVMNYEEFLATGLTGIARIAAVYDPMGTAISIVDIAVKEKISPENIAITHIPNTALRDRLFLSGLIPEGVLVLDANAKLKQEWRFTPAAFVSGKISSTLTN